MQHTVEVFRTDVSDAVEAQMLTALLLQYFPGSKISFDLEDCDKVLRIAGSNINQEVVLTVVYSNGYQCQELD